MSNTDYDPDEIDEPEQYDVSNRGSNALRRRRRWRSSLRRVHAVPAIPTSPASSPVSPPLKRVPSLFATEPAKRFKLARNMVHRDSEKMLPEHPSLLAGRLDYGSAPNIVLFENNFTIDERGVHTFMANCPYNLETGVYYFEIDIDFPDVLEYIGFHLRYIGDETPVPALNVEAVVQRLAGVHSTPRRELTDTHRMLKSFFVPLYNVTMYHWEVNNTTLLEPLSGLRATTPRGDISARLGTLLDPSAHMLHAVCDGVIVASVPISDSTRYVSGDFALVPGLQITGSTSLEAFFETSELMFDLNKYLDDRQNDIVRTIEDKAVDTEPPKPMFQDYFEYFGYEKAARACAQRPLRASVPGRALVRQIIMSGQADQLSQTLQDRFNVAGSDALQAAAVQLRAQEIAVAHLRAGTVPDFTTLPHNLTEEAATLLISVNSEEGSQKAAHALSEARQELLARAMFEITEAVGESFSSAAFEGAQPTLQNIFTKTWTIALRPAMDVASRQLLIHRYLQHQHGWA